MSRALARIQDFLRLESAAGLILMASALMALIFSNSPLAQPYFDLLGVPVTVGFGSFVIDKPLLLWINDALMAVFFLLVGLEIKRELMEGELSSLDKAALPLVAAIGGMLGPIAVFLAFNGVDSETTRGWAVPAATDIAFALGVLTLLGKRVPASLKILLLAVAIIDDLGAISIIALFYTENLAVAPLAGAAVTFALLMGLNRLGVTKLWPYILLGVVLWAFVLKSGVHATLAGVMLAAAIPLRTKKSESSKHSPLHRLEHGIHPAVAFWILPIFAFANSGVALGGLELSALAAPLTLGGALGLFFGKQIGVFGFVWLASQLRLVRRPEGVSWLQLYGLACLTGIGFTMSLFIGGLAFADPALMDQVKIGVLCGSIASAALGASLLILAGKKAAHADKSEASASEARVQGE